jgi:prolyl 4-hydroxylase
MGAGGRGMKIGPNPDRKALAKVGKLVRERLAADPGVYRVPVENGEIFAVADFMSADECARMIALIDAVARPSELFDDVYVEAYRTSWSGDVDNSDSVVRMIERRLSDLIGLDLAWSESIQGQRYQPGQEYRDHCDWFDTNATYWKKEVHRGGQRSWTAMVYLNAVEAGGATEFRNLGISFDPQPGVLLLWNNATPEGVVNPAMLHAALPVESGIKYVVTKWFRTRVWT